MVDISDYDGDISDLKLISQTRSRYCRLKKISQTVEDIADYIVDI